MGRTVYYDHNGNEVEPPKADAVKPTNADRIRAMSDEELMKFFTKLEYDGDDSFCCPVPGDCKGSCRPCFLDWLKQEVIDDNRDH